MFVRLGVKMSVHWEALGMEVVADCANGKQALEAWEMYHPDIVITDIKMPIMDGMELIQKIREKDKRTRIIILTVLEEFALAKQAISFGVSDYILKLTMTPAEMENILSRVKMELEDLKPSSNGMKTSDAWQEKIVKNYVFYHVLDRQQFSKLPLDDINLAMAVMELDNFDAVCEYLEDSHGSLVISAILNIIRELLEKDGRGLCIYLEGKRFLILSSRKSQVHSHIARLQFTDRLDKIRRRLAQYYKASVSFGISGVYDGIEHLPDMYLKCRNALDIKFYVGNGQDLDDRQDYGPVKKAYVKAQLERISQAVPASCLDQMKELSILLDYPEREVAANLFLRLITREVYHQFPDNDQRLKRLNNYAAMVSKAGTLSELADIYLECLRTSKEGVQKSKDGISKTVSDILSFIRENYSHPMSLDSIAEYVEMSPNYICGLFKREMGMNLMNYIMKFRIQKAASLMRTTHLKSYEIAEKVGFSDESYFSRCFKKMVGMSPNEYRRHDQRKEI